jgi:phage shock protein C
MNKKLFRSRSDRMLGGVCGGLSVYLDIDPSLIRIFFVILAASSTLGVPLYLILWLILSTEDDTSEFNFTGQAFSERVKDMGVEIGDAARQPSANAYRYVGAGLIVMGLLMALEKLNLPWASWLNGDVLFAILLVGGGVLLLVRTLANPGD